MKYKKHSTAREALLSAYIEIESDYNLYAKYFLNESKGNDYVGAAITSNHLEREMRLPSHATVFTAEFCAILSGLEYNLTRE